MHGVVDLTNRVYLLAKIDLNSFEHPQFDISSTLHLLSYSVSLLLQIIGMHIMAWWEVCLATIESMVDGPFRDPTIFAFRN